MHSLAGDGWGSRRAPVQKLLRADTVFAVAGRLRQKTSIKMAGCVSLVDSFQFDRLPISRGDRTREIVEVEEKNKNEREREIPAGIGQSIRLYHRFVRAKFFEKKKKRKKYLIFLVLAEENSILSIVFSSPRLIKYYASQRERERERD